MKSLSAINIRTFISNLISDRKKLVSIIAWALIGYYLLRACVLNGGDSLPSELTAKIEKRYVTCITFEDTPVWPGNTRQPECGTVDLKVIGEGTVPQKQETEGVTRAICYQIQIQNPFWSTQGEGTTRHEIKQSPKRTSYQVAVLQNGSWKIFPDQEQENEKRWKDYACPSP